MKPIIGKCIKAIFIKHLGQNYGNNLNRRGGDGGGEFL